jgi:signal transduction histidine kinase
MFTTRSGGSAPVQLERPISNVSLVVTVPVADITSAWASLLPRLLIAGGLAALFAVVVGTLLANRITRPIQQMTRASEAMAQGDYSQRIEVGRDDDDEVAHLGRAFNQMAQQVDRSTRAMRQLLANVSHELKTPLTSIQGYSQAMVDGVIEPDELGGAAEIVHQEAERMRSLVDDLLYLSQLEAGQSPLTLERIELDAAVAATANRFRYQAEAATVDIRLDLDGGAVLADERRIEQVLANLLDNALRFAPAGSQVTLRTRHEGNVVLVQVHNTGEPIPAEDMPSIFDRFYQVDQARTRNVHSGLGLAIVRELVQAHGGEATVESSVEAGTTFTVRLPAAPPDSSKPASTSEDAPAGAVHA